MSYVILCLGFSSGDPCPHFGQFVESFDHDGADGRGYGEFTPDPRKAMQFETAGEAFEFWRKRSKKRPNRWYGDRGPNRPLTATHATFITMEQAQDPEYMRTALSIAGGNNGS